MLASVSNLSAAATSIIASTSAAFASGGDVVEASEKAEINAYNYDEQRLFLYLRYYARHAIPGKSQAARALLCFVSSNFSFLRRWNIRKLCGGYAYEVRDYSPVK